MSESNVWECECGNVEYGLFPPKECGECLALNSYIKLAEDDIEEAEERNVIAKTKKKAKESRSSTVSSSKSRSKKK